MALIQIFSTWLSRLRGQPKTVEVPHVSETAMTSQMVVDKNVYHFGLDWRSTPPQKMLSGELNNARIQGSSHYVMSPMRDVLGYFTSTPKQRGVAFSAAIQLSETISHSGIELFVFACDNQQYGLVALNESQPVPGFDYLGSRDDVLQLAEDFKAIQQDQTIRIAGDAGLFEEEEHITRDSVFRHSESNAKLIKLPNPNRTRMLMALGLLIVASVSTGLYMVQIERERIAEEQRKLEQDPNRLYERTITQALQDAGVSGDPVLKNWLAVVGHLPLRRNGWHLTKLICVPAECTATWARAYGNFSEFHDDLPFDIKSSKEVQEGDNPAAASIQTVHVIPPTPDAPPIERAALGELRPTLRAMASKLQDTSILNDARTSLTEPTLYPDNSVGSINELHRPVVRGRWSITHEAWTLRDLALSAYEVPELLEITFMPAKTEAIPIYKLTGSYYAKGKSF